MVHFRFRSLVVLAALLVVSCGPPAPHGVGAEGGALISDQVHGDGTPGFYFLFPMVSPPRYGGTFRGGLQPVVRIEELPPGTRGTLATYTTTAGPYGGRVFVLGESYNVLWPTAPFALSPSLTYRIHVTVGGLELGYADVDVVRRLRELLTVDAREYVPLLDDLILPIRFRIEPEALRCVGVTCAAAGPCHVAGTCDPHTGTCSNPTSPDGAGCDDGDACTTSDTCQAGACVGAIPVVCLAQDMCHEAGACDPATGACSTPASANGTPCFDGDLCSLTDVCQDGVCTGTNPLTCAATDQCHAAGVCEPSTGACPSPPLANGTACDDGDACTQTDACQGGACVGGSPVACVALDQCHDAGACEPATGACSNPVRANGSACEDGDPCTASDTCQAGACASSASTCTPPPALEVASGVESLVIVQGATQSVATVITVKNVTSGVIVTNQLTIGPDPGGVGVVSDYPAGGYAATSDTAFVLNQSFKGLAVGTYQATNTVAWQGGTAQASRTFVIHVVPAYGEPVVMGLGATPGGIAWHRDTTVTFTARVAGFLQPPAALSLHRVLDASAPEVGALRDDGVEGDLQAGDGVYTGRVLISAGDEGLLEFQASATFPGVPEERFSPPLAVPVSCDATPVRGSTVLPHNLVFDGASGEALVADEVLVRFAEGAGCADRSAVAAQVGGAIVGWAPRRGLHQIAIARQALAADVRAVVAELARSPSVLDVYPNHAGVVASEVVPNDPLYASQTVPRLVRADEAWVIARGGRTIAIVDTGVDYRHEDLAGKVDLGPDLLSTVADGDPMDEAPTSHGTHVAGIAAASAENGLGIAGISWASRILAVRAVGGTYLALAQGIEEAAARGASIVNVSGGGLFDSPDVQHAVTTAAGMGCLLVAAAGNTDVVPLGAAFYPAAYPEALAVANTTATDQRSAGSNAASWVDLSAPGEDVVSTLRNNGYGPLTGTSMAAPVVSGAAAVLWSRFPSWTAAQVRARLEATAAPLADANLGRGRVDLFEAVFNGGFEDDLTGWTAVGTAGALPSLGPIVPTQRGKMGFVSSGPDNAQIQSSLEQSFTIQHGVTSIPLQFDYDFVTEEYPEWVHSIYNDNMRIILVSPSGEEVQVAYEDVNTSTFTLVGGIDFPGGDSTTGRTGWKTVRATIPVTEGAGVYRVLVRDEGDGIYDSDVLLDNVRFRHVSP